MQNQFSPARTERQSSPKVEELSEDQLRELMTRGHMPKLLRNVVGDLGQLFAAGQIGVADCIANETANNFNAMRAAIVLCHLYLNSIEQEMLDELQRQADHHRKQIQEIESLGVLEINAEVAP